MKFAYIRNGNMTVTDEDGERAVELGFVGDEFDLDLVADKGKFLDLMDADGCLITVNKTDIKIEQ